MRELKPYEKGVRWLGWMQAVSCNRAAVLAYRRHFAAADSGRERRSCIESQIYFKEELRYCLTMAGRVTAGPLDTLAEAERALRAECARASIIDPAAGGNGASMDAINTSEYPAARAAGKIFRLGVVQFDGGPDAGFPCYLAGIRWNGWACPYFTRAQADVMLAEFRYGCTVTWSEEHAGYIETPDEDGEEAFLQRGVECQTENGVLTLYPVSAFSVCWDEAEPEETTAP